MYTFRTSSIQSVPRSRHNNHAQAPRLPNNTRRNPLQTQPRKPRLTVLDLGNLVDMLQANSADGAQHRIPHGRTVGARLPLLPVVVVHRAWHVARPADLALRRRHARGGQKQRCRRRGAQAEVERAVWPHGDASGDGGAGVVVRGAGVEFLVSWSVLRLVVCVVVAACRRLETSVRENRLCRNPCSSRLCCPARGRRGATARLAPRLLSA